MAGSDCEMPCYHPLDAWRSQSINKSGKRSLVFKEENGYPGTYLQVPCGQCIGCRLERSRQWALRCVHETTLHQDSAFITLTYNEENLPEDGGLHKEHFQKFMKRFRKSVSPIKLRYFHCGEYGEENKRPHYHAIIWGYDFPDKKLHARTNNGDALYISDHLSRLWPFGFSTIGSVTFESSAYVARYIMKKVNNNNNAEKVQFRGEEKTKAEIKAYSRVHPDTGELFLVEPEYVTMSRGHGIGQGWYEKYGEETYRDDYIVERGIKMQPPKYYDKQYPDIEIIKTHRIRKAMLRAKDNTPERLRVRENCKIAQIRSLKRNLQE